MKKSITLVFLIMVLGLNSSFAQIQIPNGDFETWTGANTATSWGSVSLMGLNSLFRTSTVHSGSFAALCRTTDTVMFATPVLVPGIATLGTIDVITQTVKGGIPCTDKPDNFRGYYAYTPQGADAMNILIYLWEYNSVSHTKDTVAIGTLTSSTTVSSYTAFDIPLTWDAGYVGTPDSLNVVLVSSGLAAVGNSRAYFDDLTLYYAAVGLNVNLGDIIPAICPNPAQDRISITANAETDIVLFNSLGETVLSARGTGQAQQLNVSDLPRGLYFVRHMSQNGITTSKIVLQ